MIGFNSARKNLITRFYCAKCGGPLNIDYDAPPNYKGGYLDGDPTGGTVMYNAISIEPCRGCIDKELAPARKIAEAVRELTGAKP